jgi:hypothetical protein
VIVLGCEFRRLSPQFAMEVARSIPGNLAHRRILR